MERITAILGDIHANLEALKAVLDDCRAMGVTDYLCTGDIVGYNASPKECLDIVRSLNCPVVRGNHDHYVSSRQDLSDFQPNAAYVVEWTRKQLTMEDIYYLRSLPLTEVRCGIALVHATMDGPENFGYVFDSLQAEANFVYQKPPLCFHGHTHCPMIYEKRLDGVWRIDPIDFQLEMGRKYFINAGSVGQPRDGDPRASYVVYNHARRHVTYRRIDYDFSITQQKILAAGLPARLAERIAEGR